MTMNNPYALQSLLKDNHKHLHGLSDSVLGNIEACKALSNMLRSSMGPNGMHKIVVNHLNKLTVTSDTATIVNELEIVHPAAKLIVMAAAAQQHDRGDGTNFLVTLCGELLHRAQFLIRAGLHPSEIAEGYRNAADISLEFMKTLVFQGSHNIELRSESQIISRIKTAVASKQYGNEHRLSLLVMHACKSVYLNNMKTFDVDNIRITKIPGCSLADSGYLEGMLITRGPEGRVRTTYNAKIAVYAQGINSSSTETKGTVLIRKAYDLLNYNKTEEVHLAKIIKGIADLGVKVVVGGSSFSDIALHFLDEYGIMVFVITSKFELRRFCRLTGCYSLAKLKVPSIEELGFAKGIRVREIGQTNCIVVEQASSEGKLATVIIRGATQQILEDVERAVDCGINVYRSTLEDSRTVPAGGATEIEIARHLKEMARDILSSDQYAFEKFAEALEVIPKTLAENSGINVNHALGSLWCANKSGRKTAGLDIRSGVAMDLSEDGIVDLYTTKWWALRMACDVVVRVLKLDHIIMAKQAGETPEQRGNICHN